MPTIVFTATIAITATATASSVVRNGPYGCDSYRGPLRPVLDGILDGLHSLGPSSLGPHLGAMGNRIVFHGLPALRKAHVVVPGGHRTFVELR